MYPILAYFVQHVLMVRGLCQPECKAFLLLADVMDMLASVHMNIITPDMLQRSIDSFLQACIACGASPASSASLADIDADDAGDAGDAGDVVPEVGPTLPKTCNLKILKS